MQQGSDSPSQASPAPQPDMRKWQFSREFLNEGTPSRKDNISLKKESSQRRLALSFGQDVGFLLKMSVSALCIARSHLLDAMGMGLPSTPGRLSSGHRSLGASYRTGA